MASIRVFFLLHPLYGSVIALDSSGNVCMNMLWKQQVYSSICFSDETKVKLEKCIQAAQQNFELNATTGNTLTVMFTMFNILVCLLALNTNYNTCNLTVLDGTNSLT